jgi:hypothetical protein
LQSIGEPQSIGTEIVTESSLAQPRQRACNQWRSIGRAKPHTYHAPALTAALNVAATAMSAVVPTYRPIPPADDAALRVTSLTLAP